jgi:hypothetical protein
MAKKKRQAKFQNLGVDAVMAQVRKLRRNHIAKSGHNRPRPTLQSLGLGNVKKEVADMAPRNVAERIANCIAEAARSILSGKGVNTCAVALVGLDRET